MESHPIRETSQGKNRTNKDGEKESEEMSLYQLENKRLREKRIASLHKARETKKLLHEKKKEELSQPITATPEDDRNNVQDTKLLLNGSSPTMAGELNSSEPPLYNFTDVFYLASERLFLGAVEVGASMATAYLLGRAVAYCVDTYREWNANGSSIEQDLSDGDGYYTTDENENI